MAKISDEEEQWRIESDLRTLKEAMEIISDKKRLKAAQDLAANESESLKKVADTDYLKSIGIGR
jgi:hypothetical protein